MNASPLKINSIARLALVPNGVVFHSLTKLQAFLESSKMLMQHMTNDDQLANTYTFRIEYEEDGQIKFDYVFAIDEVDAYFQFIKKHEKVKPAKKPRKRKPKA